MRTQKGPYCSQQDAKRTEFEGVWDAENSCYDIDECELNLHDCHKDAKECFADIKLGHKVDIMPSAIADRDAK